jgi:hypothetical protein
LKRFSKSVTPNRREADIVRRCIKAERDHRMAVDIGGKDLVCTRFCRGNADKPRARTKIEHATAAHDLRLI